MPPSRADLARLRASAQRVLGSAAGLPDDQLRTASGLPGWTRGHVVTHLARAADSRRGLLLAARTDRVGRQYESEEQRAWQIDAGASRPPKVIRADLDVALDQLLETIDTQPAATWVRPAEWLSAGRQPVERVIPSMWRELEYHHVDLNTGYRPADWPAELVAVELPRVVDVLRQRPGGPALALDPRGGALWITSRTGSRMTVVGPGPELLAWLTGRADGSALHRTPGTELPGLPPLA